MKIRVKQAKHFPEHSFLHPDYPIQCREILELSDMPPAVEPVTVLDEQGNIIEEIPGRPQQFPPDYSPLEDTEVEMTLAEFSALKAFLKPNYENYRTEVLVPKEERVNYQDYRSRAYPAIGDQLDMIYKGIKELSLSSPSLNTWVAAIDAVKARYPKP